MDERSELQEAGRAPDTRPVLAALANAHARRVYAQVVLGVPPEEVGRDLGASRRRRAVSALVDAGLVREVEGRVVEVPDAIGRLLAAVPAARSRGVERYLDGRGRIDRYPRDAGERHALLRFVARRVLAEGEVLTEAELGERLSRFSEDTATLRRYLVEEELLERTRSGSEYAHVTDEAS